MYSVMWSEHCSYKSSKVHLRQFGEKTTDARREQLLVGIGENAGVVDIGQGWAVTFKVESHNHPSYVEPYQGAATGVGGIVRDIMRDGRAAGRGHGPAAVRRGRPPRHRAGCCPASSPASAATATAWACPTSAARSSSTPATRATRWSTRCASASMRHEDIHLANASGAGNKVILFGARPAATASAAPRCWRPRPSTTTGPSKRPAVQVGDPFAEKVLIECCLELFAAKRGRGHPGPRRAPGCPAPPASWPATATAACTCRLDRVPLRDTTLSPEEILMSESQERMMAVVAPDKLDAFLAICDKWDVKATVIGEVTDGGPPGDRLARRDRSSTSPPRTVAHDGPVYERPYARPAWLDALQADARRRAAAPGRRPATSCARPVLQLARLAEPGLQGLGHRPVRPLRAGQHGAGQPDDAGVIRVDEETGLGVAIATDGNGRFAELDPYDGRAAGAGRGVPQRRDDRRHAAGRHRLPELRLARGPGGDVAVRRGRHAASPTAASSSASR